jgi:hypothetical protein
LEQDRGPVIGVVRLHGGGRGGRGGAGGCDEQPAIQPVTYAAPAAMVTRAEEVVMVVAFPEGV